jgi:putative aldouronate transport system permease protein
MITTALFAYPLARKIRGTRIFNTFIYITMLFGGGMIPTFYVVRMTGLLDSLWSLIIPALISPFNVFIMRSFFEGISGELIESASIDGASELRIFVRIILPLSLPVVATISLFYAVGYWNKFFDAIIYIRSVDKRPLQLLLRELLISVSNERFAEMIAGMSGEARAGDVAPTTLKMATVTLSVLPVMMVYPFVQKYFVKGVMLGAVKG